MITSGKYKGKTIRELLNAGEYKYIVWLKESKGVEVAKKVYDYCKSELYIQDSFEPVDDFGLDY